MRSHPRRARNPSSTAFAMPGVVKGPDLSKYKDKKGATRVNTAPAPEKEETGWGVFGWLFGSGSSKDTVCLGTLLHQQQQTDPLLQKNLTRTAKKQLTEKQQAALAKMKGGTK